MCGIWNSQQFPKKLDVNCSSDTCSLWYSWSYIAMLLAFLFGTQSSYHIFQHLSEHLRTHAESFSSGDVCKRINTMPTPNAWNCCCNWGGQAFFLWGMRAGRDRRKLDAAQKLGWAAKQIISKSGRAVLLHGINSVRAAAFQKKKKRWWYATPLRKQTVFVSGCWRSQS